MSRHSIIMVVVLVISATVLFPAIRATVMQKSRISAISADIAEREEKVAQLKAEVDRWDDPAYVKTQARERFNYVMPGEVGYVVLDPSRSEAGEADPASAAARQAQDQTGSWFGTLWESTQEAGRAPADPLGSATSR